MTLTSALGGDDEPDRLRTHVAKRGTAFNDDWFAFSLDSAGTGQMAYHLFTNTPTNVGSQIEQCGRDFQVDTAFSNRTGFTAGWSFGEINFHPRSGTEF